jgi:hypothetical protein
MKIYLKQIKENVRTPAEDKDEDDDEGHLDGLHFGLRNEAP